MSREGKEKEINKAFFLNGEGVHGRKSSFAR